MYAIIRTINSDHDLMTIIVNVSAIKTILNLQSNDLSGHKCINKVKIFILCEGKEICFIHDETMITLQ